MNRTSPALSVTGGLPSTSYSSEPSRTLMISSPGCLCLGNAAPGAKSTRTWTTSRPGTLRSCRWRSVRLIPGCCACARSSTKPLPTISSAAAMIRVVVMPNPLVPDAYCRMSMVPATESPSHDSMLRCRSPRLRLQPGLDSPEQPEAHLAVIARERNHETHPPVARGVGIARERADPLHGAGLVHAAVAAAEQVGVGRKELEHFGKAAGGEAVVAAD